MLNNVELYQKYLNSCIAQHHDTQKTTYAVYKNYMMQFLRWLERHHKGAYLLDEKLLKQMVFIIEDYMVYCREVLENNSQSIKNKIVAISTFYRWCVKRSLIDYHPFDGKIDRPVVTQQDKVREDYYLTWRQIFTVSIRAEDTPEKFDLRSRLLWELFLDSGFRISAVQNLCMDQLDLDHCRFKNVREKGGKVRELYFYPTTKILIQKYLAERESLGIDTKWFLWAQYNGKINQMSQMCIRNRIKKLGNLISLPKLYPHTLRKTAINNVDKLLDRAAAVDFAGHQNSTTTENHYIQKISDEVQHDRLALMRRNAGLL